MTKIYLLIDIGQKCIASFLVTKIAYLALSGCKSKGAFLYDPGYYKGKIITVLDEKNHYKEIKIMPDFASKILKLCKAFDQI